MIDVACAIPGHDADYASQAVRNIYEKYPEVHEKIMDFKFPGRGQRKTAVTDARGIVEVVMLLPGRHAAHVRRQAAELLVRYLGGDVSLVGEVCALRGLQERLAAEQPEDPLRAFGEAVEVVSNVSGPMPMVGQLAQACADTVAHAIPGIVARLTAHIDERLAQDRQRVNLNVRAPKRSSPYDPPITRNVAGVGRPLPLAKFLDEKAAADSSWCEVRRSLTPFFGMQMQILKKRKLRSEGAQAIYVEQNHRPQLLFTEGDRELMEEAWEMMSAHREELVARLRGPAPAVAALPAAPVPLAVPRVIQMLRQHV